MSARARPSEAQARVLSYLVDQEHGVDYHSTIVRHAQVSPADIYECEQAGWIAPALKGQTSRITPAGLAALEGEK